MAGLMCPECGVGRTIKAGNVNPDGCCGVCGTRLVTTTQHTLDDLEEDGRHA